MNKLRSFLIYTGRFIRNLQIRLLNKRIHLGKNVVIDFGTRIYCFKGQIIIGDNVYLRAIAKTYQAGMPFPTTILTDVKDACLKIGANSRINGAYIHAQKEVIIGKNCVIASGVQILDSNGHEVYSKDRTLIRDTPGTIMIGNNVWIGLNVIILKNTVIEDNCIISAGSIVKGHYSKSSLVTGNPAISIKQLDII